MEKMPLVSIVMPAYNAEKYILDAVASVQKQSYPNWELIIVEDGSTDQTWNIMQKVANDKIRIYQNETNLGPAKTRNHGIRLAKGNWIAFLDSDDIWSLDKLNKQIELINSQPETDLVFTGSEFIDQDGNHRDFVFHVPKTITYHQLLKQNIISCSSVMVKKECIEKHLFPDENFIHEDFAAWLEILKAHSIAYGLDEPLLTYRLSKQSKSGNKLKSVKMNWNVYRYIGLNKIHSIYYMFYYAWNGMKKHIKINHHLSQNKVGI